MSDVLFPIVGCNGAHIATVRCDCLNARDYPAGRALVLARDEQEIERILADSRSNEPSGAEIARPIWVRFMPQQFTGRSYGLALALADKRARYRSDSVTNASRLYATGLIIEDGFGRIGKVSSFENKLLAIADAADAGDIMILAKGNLDDASPQERELLDQLAKKGVVCRVADRLDELTDLYTTIEDEGLSEPLRRGDTDDQAPTAFFAATSSGSREADDGKRPTSKPDEGLAWSFRKTAALGTLFLVTGLLAFAAGDWFGGGSLVRSYADETTLAAETTPSVATHRENLLANPSFEQGEGQVPIGWITYSRGKHDHADYVRSGGIDGSLILEHGSNKAFYVDTHQVLSVAEGYYAFTAWIRSEGERKAHRMRVNGDEEVHIDIPMTGPDQFQKMAIHCIRVTGGRLAVGFYMDAFKESSAAYDKVAVTRNSKTADGQDCAEAHSRNIEKVDETVLLASSSKNLLTNPSFEKGRDQQPIGWQTYSRGEHDDADSVGPGGVDGVLMLEHRGDGPFYVDTFQQVHSLNGYYAMSALIDADDKEKVNRMYANGDQLIELDIPRSAEHGFQQLRIHCIKATHTKIIVGFYTDTHQASATAYDDVQLYRHRKAEDGTDCTEH
jgi:hypothetical protein